MARVIMAMPASSASYSLHSYFPILYFIFSIYRLPCEHVSEQDARHPRQQPPTTERSRYRAQRQPTHVDACMRKENVNTYMCGFYIYA